VHLQAAARHRQLASCPTRRSSDLVCGWVKEAARLPVWAKLTPNITHIDAAGEAALAAGCDGISAINTILCVMGVDLETLRPQPRSEEHTSELQSRENLVCRLLLEK